MAFVMRLPQYNKRIPTKVVTSDSSTKNESSLLDFFPHQKEEIQNNKIENNTHSILNIPGIQSERGLQGLQGLQGERGDVGLQGLQGERGDVGLQGLQGLQGDVGLQGLQGLQGERGETGFPGERGEQGFPGENGVQGCKGPKIVLWNGSVELITTETDVCIIPYDGSLYSLSKIYIVINGLGQINVSLVDTISNTIISTIQQNLGTEKKVQVFSMDTFNNISNDNTVLTLKMSSDNNDSVKVLDLEFNM